MQITLAAARVNAGLTQEEVANDMKISRATLSGWEKGKTQIGVAELDYLSRKYSIPIDCFLLPSQSTDS